jgi:4-hydroxy-3-methylbut-2-enyl diphosphate reductase
MGFCFGVRRAIELVEKTARERGSLQTLGPLVHNRQVVERLASCGVAVADGVEDVSGRIVAIASHGVGPDVMDRLKARGIEVVDATCPFVGRAQTVARNLASSGFEVLVFGDAGHPEVRAVLGWAGDKASASLEIPTLVDLPRRVGILCQTTQSQPAFAEYVARVVLALSPRLLELQVHNTICDATRQNQDAALELARRVDSMLVVGGRDSANTRRLAEICAAAGVATHRIESAADIQLGWLQNARRVGITAGASTPDEVIEEVELALKRAEGKS